MSEPYTPTTEEVRFCYAGRCSVDCNQSHKWDDFERWLAERDRKVAAKTLRDAAGDWYLAAPAAHEGTIAWLRNRADRLEAGNDES